MLVKPDNLQVIGKVTFYPSFFQELFDFFSSSVCFRIEMDEISFPDISSISEILRGCMVIGYATEVKGHFVDCDVNIFVKLGEG